MTMNPKQKDIESKKELGQDPTYKKTLPKISSSSSSSSSRQWSSSKQNPRIVRVSRAFGGKDRHSKVCTVRGLRDRRIRLSVPTAIQLYDLQDRLGLNQPSKVIDWLIDVTKNEIDKLPPLPMLPSNFTQMFHPSSQDLGISKINNHEQENQEGFGGFLGQLSSQNLFPMNNQTSFPNMAYNNPNFFHWDPSNLSLSQFGVGFSENHQPNDNLSMLFPYLCPSSAIIPSYITPSVDNDLRQVNQNPLLPTTLHLISPQMKSFMNPKNVNVSQENETLQEKDKSLKIQR